MNDHAPTANHLLRQAKSFLKSLKPGPLAIAVSGGSDSLGVLLAICEANGSAEVNSSSREIICFTVNHQLRVEAADEARFVGEFCSFHGVKHQTLDWTDEKPDFGIQNAARQARYKLMANACSKNNAIGLVTGHTQDDQLETVTMRASRNTSNSTRGLSGMAPATLFFNKMWVLRPFLDTSKGEFREFLKTRNQRWIEDPSNQDETFERVRVRKKADFACSLSEINHAQDLRQKISVDAAEYLSKNCNVRDGLFAEVNIISNDIPVLLRAIESLIDVIGGRDRRLSSSQIEKLSRFVRSENPKRMTLGRTLIEKKFDVVVLRREGRNLDVMEIGAQTSGVWDGRFRIDNKHGKKHLIVNGHNDLNGFPPTFSWASEGAGDQMAVGVEYPLVVVRRYVNRFDEILSSFDLPLAVEIAKLFDSSEFKVIPFVYDR